jgi:hypothetical protein
MIVDSYRFLPRTFRPYYEGRGPYPGEEAAVWAPFEKRLAASRIALLTSAGLYVKGEQLPFDLEREQSDPDWGDPSWRSIPAAAEPAALGLAHLHINEDDVLADPEIALPSRLLQQLAGEGVVGSVTDEHVSVMGYQERSLATWRDQTVREVIDRLRELGTDGLVLAPA